MKKGMKKMKTENELLEMRDKFLKDWGKKLIDY